MFRLKDGLNKYLPWFRQREKRNTCQQGILEIIEEINFAGVYRATDNFIVFGIGKTSDITKPYSDLKKSKLKQLKFLLFPKTSDTTKPYSDLKNLN